MSRLTLEQYNALNDIISYMSKARPELEWRGFKVERRYLTKNQWHNKVATMLYTTYNDLYPSKPISHEAIVDFFDDDYVNELTSFCKRFKKLFTKCLTFKKKKRFIEEEDFL